MYIDLHVHSTASDGQYSPDELVRLASEAGIKLLALTDHDAIAGISEAEATAAEVGLFFVPGIEISVQDTEEIHILGYGIDISQNELIRFCEEAMSNRAWRGRRICEYLQNLGIVVDYGEIQRIAGNGLIARPHFAAWLMEHGFVSTSKEAFDHYLDTPAFHEATERLKPSAREAIDLIHIAGGKAVLAHPGNYSMGMEKRYQLVCRLAGNGLDGVECFYSRNTKQETLQYLNWVDEFDLKISCGSDFHGEKVKPDIHLGMEFDMDRYGNRVIVEAI